MIELLRSFGISEHNPGAFGAHFVSALNGQKLVSYSPIDGAALGSVCVATMADYDRVVTEAITAFHSWRTVPAPVRGQIVREIADELRRQKVALAQLVTLEVGKIPTEGEGEIQEAIDVADYAAGISRQLYGHTMQSERPEHRMFEQWHPVGPVGVITAFNFPAAVWAWNSMIAAVCGDVVIWKPSEAAPLVALAMNALCAKVAARHGHHGIFNLVIGDGPELGKAIAQDRRIPVVSATGSCAMGRSVGEAVARRLGRSILELGGNNGVIVLKDADLKAAVSSVFFGAAGTAGQRCTTTRRVIVEREIEGEFSSQLCAAYSRARIGDPRSPGTLVGPLINRRAVDSYLAAIERAKAEGGTVLFGGRTVGGMPSDLYVEPTIIRAHRGMKIVHEETFAPIVYILAVEDLAEAIELHNEVPQGLTSAIFTTDLRSAERFLSSTGSDCGIANVNIGTSGAEIGGAFGGEKDTGGGREAGADSWRQYMRRQTSTINYGRPLPLAQGVKFSVED